MTTLLAEYNRSLPDPERVYRDGELAELLGLPPELANRLLDFLPGADVGDGVRLFSGRLVRDYLAATGLQKIRDDLMRATD